MWKSRTLAVLALTGALALTACGSSKSGGSAGGSSSAAPKQVTLTVLAAASLTDIAPQLATQFSAQNPGVTIKWSFGGSATLATSITQGAPADVFLSASPAPMQTVVSAGDALGTPLNFVSNQLVIAVPPGNPKNINSLADLTKPGLKVVLCAADQPCGSAATKALTTAKVNLKPVSLEPDVKSALTKVELNEADAALVYRTDAKSAAGKVDGIEFPESKYAINQYPAAALKASKNPTQAQAFVTFIESSAALQDFEAAGFQAPSN